MSNLVAGAGCLPNLITLHELDMKPDLAEFSACSLILSSQRAMQQVAHVLRKGVANSSQRDSEMTPLPGTCSVCERILDSSHATCPRTEFCFEVFVWLRV